MSHSQPGSAPPADTPDSAGTAAAAESGTSGDDTLNLELPQEWTELLAERDDWNTGGTGPPGDLLDAPAFWPATDTDAGRLELVPVHPARDLPLVSAWMNDPAVAAFWELAGPEHVAEAHLRPQIEGDGRSVPCLGVLDGSPMSYWEIYRADLDPLARHCRTHPHDTGIHLLIGGVAHRGRGIGTTLLRAVADLVLDQRPLCSRVLAEPDVRNVPSVAAFLAAGFRLSAEVQLPGKRAALMVRDRALRAVL